MPVTKAINFVVAHTGDDRPWIGRLFYSVSRELKDFIGEVSPEDIVYEFEVIDVDMQEYQFHTRTARGVEQARQRSLQMTAIGQTGQIIMRSESLNLPHVLRK